MKKYLSGDESTQLVADEELEQKSVLLLLAQGFEDAEAAAAIDIFGWTAYRPSIATVKVITCGFHDVVTSGFGMTLKTDLHIDEVSPDDYDALVIPGGFHNLGYDEVYDDQVKELVRAFRAQDKPVASMCVGVLPVAEAGLLVGGEAATYTFSSKHDNCGKLREHDCSPVDGVADWKGIISCSGPAYSEQVIMMLLEYIAGKEATAEVSRYRRGHE